MLKKILFFLKYNNAVILILAIIFVVGTGVFAASEPGQEFIGQKETAVSGFDNTLLLEADLEKFDMDFKVEKVTEDEEYYYVTYTCLELIEKDNAWQYQLNEKNRKVSKKIKKDLGVYLAEELKEEYDAKIKELKIAKTKAETVGESVRQEVQAYSGLLGKALEISAKVFSGYEPVKISALPTPTIPAAALVLSNKTEEADEVDTESVADNFTAIINQYMEENDPDGDTFIGVLDNCPNIANIDQADSDMDGIGDACEGVLEEEITDDIIEQESGVMTGLTLITGDSSDTDFETEAEPEIIPEEIPASEEYETVEVVEIE